MFKNFLIFICFALMFSFVVCASRGYKLILTKIANGSTANNSSSTNDDILYVDNLMADNKNLIEEKRGSLSFSGYKLGDKFVNKGENILDSNIEFLEIERKVEDNNASAKGKYIEVVFDYNTKIINYITIIGANNYAQARINESAYKPILSRKKLDTKNVLYDGSLLVSVSEESKDYKACTDATIIIERVPSEDYLDALDSILYSSKEKNDRGAFFQKYKIGNILEDVDDYKGKVEDGTYKFTLKDFHERSTYDEDSYYYAYVDPQTKVIKYLGSGIDRSFDLDRYIIGKIYDVKFHVSLSYFSNTIEEFVGGGRHRRRVTEWIGITSDNKLLSIIDDQYHQYLLLEDIKKE